MFIPIIIGVVLSLIDNGRFLLFGSLPIFVISSIVWIRTDTEPKKGTQNYPSVEDKK